MSCAGSKSCPWPVVDDVLMLCVHHLRQRVNTQMGERSLVQSSINYSLWEMGHRGHKTNRRATES